MLGEFPDRSVAVDSLPITGKVLENAIVCMNEVVLVGNPEVCSRMDLEERIIANSDRSDDAV